MVKQWEFTVILLGIIFLYTGWSHLSASQQAVNVNPLVQTFQTNELQVETWMVHHGALLDRPLSEQQLKHLTNYFRLKERSTSFPSSRGSTRAERVFISDWQRNIPLEMRVAKNGQQDYLVINVKATRQSAQSLQDAVHDVAEGLEQIGLEPEIRVSIQGTAPHLLNRDEQQQFIHRVMHNLNAHEVEALRDMTSTSVSAFSPQLGKTIKANGRELNVQIAARSDKVNNRTVITIGTPIITIEY